MDNPTTLDRIRVALNLGPDASDDAIVLEVEKAVATADDYFDSVRSAMAEDCGTEKHCACVGSLRKELRDMRSNVGATMARSFSKLERDLKSSQEKAQSLRVRLSDARSDLAYQKMSDPSGLSKREKQLLDTLNDTLYTSPGGNSEGSKLLDELEKRFAAEEQKKKNSEAAIQSHINSRKMLEAIVDIVSEDHPYIRFEVDSLLSAMYGAFRVALVVGDTSHVVEVTPTDLLRRPEEFAKRLHDAASEMPSGL